MQQYSKKQKDEILRSELDLERATFLAHWRELGDYILPRRPRFTVTDVNRGDRRNQKIIDSTATLAARTLKSGMMSGVTSPARPWFRLTTPDFMLAENGTVKEWLSYVSDRMTAIFLKSNLYNVLPIIYGDMGVFGTAAMYCEEDFTGEVVRFTAFPVGSYMVANNAAGKVDTFIREFRLTVSQVIEKFGKKLPNGEIDFSNFSDHVKNLYQQNSRAAWIDICHVIRPNDDYNPNKLESKYKKYVSRYYERGSAGGQANGSSFNNSDVYLSESGYDYFPVLCPRWETSAEDVYGTDCPAMAALGDIKQLQLGEKRMMQAIDKMVNPPMVAPNSMKTSKSSILSGDITYVDVREGMQGFRPAHEVNARIAELEGKQGQLRDRIRRAFYEDLFLMLAASDRRTITAREIDERHEEKLLALGSVLEQINQDLLDPLIDIIFDIMMRQGLIPPAPKELQGQPLKVEYISIMAQAQKLIGLGGIERFFSFANQIVGVNPEALDKIDLDQALDVYGDLTSLQPRIVRSDEMVEQIRAQRAQAQQAQRQAEALAQGANAAKTLSETKLNQESVLDGMIQNARAGALV